jgi:hypothetical protein
MGERMSELDWKTLQTLRDNVPKGQRVPFVVRDVDQFKRCCGKSYRGKA